MLNTLVLMYFFISIIQYSIQFRSLGRHYASSSHFTSQKTWSEPWYGCLCCQEESYWTTLLAPKLHNHGRYVNKFELEYIDQKN